MAKNFISPVILIAIISHFSEQKPNSVPNNESINETYIECKSMMTSRCFGTPNDCIAHQNCVILLSLKPTQTGPDFMLQWILDSSGGDKWVGAALSEDGRMGDDSVTECILWKNNSVTVRQGLTQGYSGVITVEPIPGISKETGRISDNIVSCSWSRAADTMVKNLEFNILNKTYFVILALGPIVMGITGIRIVDKKFKFLIIFR